MDQCLNQLVTKLVDDASNSLEDMELGGLGEETPSLTREQVVTAQQLRTEIQKLIPTVRRSKLKLSDKVKAISLLVKSHEALTKSERSVAGLDKHDHTTLVNQGVIMVPEKASPETWHETAMVEVTDAQDGSEKVG